jgi:toxin-antitoxin system PIN domain toxin
VKLPDANLFLYAADRSSPRHELALNWVETALSGTETVALAWSVLLAFVRVATHGQIFVNPLTTAQAFDLVETWMAQPATTVVQPTDRHASVLRRLIEPLGAAGNLVSDAHLAALAIEHGAELCSADADFSRFPGLRWTNPFQGTP